VERKLEKMNPIVGEGSILIDIVLQQIQIVLAEEWAEILK
jgi:hypothetical protein